MKKILILETATSYYGKKQGGSYLQAEYYRNLLNKKGYQTQLFIGESKENILLKLFRIINTIHKSDYIIGFGTPLLNVYLQWLCFILGKKGIFCIDTIIAALQIMNDHIKRKFYKKRYLTYAFIQYLTNILLLRILPPRLNLVNIASCQYVKDKLIKTGFCLKENKFLYPTVEILRRKKKENPINKKVLFYGTLYRGRGVRDLVQSCRILWKKNYNFKLIILGWPIDSFTKKHLTNDIRNINRRNLAVKGYVSNIEEYIKEASVVVLPFRYSCSFQTPYTLLEPMGLGVPVITTDVGSHCEWIKDGETGLICEKENPQDIADKIETVFKNKTLVERITTGAYSLLKKRYGEKDLLLETLQKLEHER